MQGTESLTTLGLSRTTLIWFGVYFPLVRNGKQWANSKLLKLKPVSLTPHAKPQGYLVKIRDSSGSCSFTQAINNAFGEEKKRHDLFARPQRQLPTHHNGVQPAQLRCFSIGSAGWALQGPCQWSAVSGKDILADYLHNQTNSPSTCTDGTWQFV